MSDSDNARRILARLEQAGHQAYLVGGCVRDRILGHEPKDYDICTSARPEEVAALFGRTIDIGKSKDFGIVAVVIDGDPYEVATFRKDGAYSDGRRPDSVVFGTIEDDASRRDFTINALYESADGTILDFHDGQDDLRAGLIRCVGDPGTRFEEDRLRVLRAIRFSCQLGFEIEYDTESDMEGVTLAGLAWERIDAELTKAIQADASLCIEALLRSGHLGYVLPEVEALIGVEQDPEFHPEGDAYVHTLRVLEQTEKEWQGGIPATLAWAALLHDIGKAVTTAPDETGRIRSLKHAEVGAEMVDAVADRLRWPNDRRERVKWLVANHMRVGAAPEMKLSKLRRLMAEPNFNHLLRLHRADRLGGCGDVASVEFLEVKLREFVNEPIKPEPLISGKDLIGLGIKPGPIFGKILSKIEDYQLDNLVTTKEQAIGLVPIVAESLNL